jgi:hypothetical protein
MDRNAFSSIPQVRVSAGLCPKRAPCKEQRVKGEDTFFLISSVQRDGAPGGTRTCGILLRRCAIQNSKCRFWCRLRGNASFISLLNWTDVGLKQREVEAPAPGVEVQCSVCFRPRRPSARINQGCLPEPFSFPEADFWPGTVSGCAVTQSQSPKCQEWPHHRLYDGIWLKYWDGIMFLGV